MLRSSSCPETEVDNRALVVPNSCLLLLHLRGWATCIIYEQLKTQKNFLNKGGTWPLSIVKGRFWPDSDT